MSLRGEKDRSDVKMRYGPSGIHLLDRSTGLNLLIDEVSIPELRWDQAPRHVSIALTNSCDLHCSYCYAPKARARLREEQVEGWIDELDANGCLGVGFGGGEPTLHRHLASICSHAALATSMAVSLTTHGHWNTPQLLNELAGTVHFIRVSVDGVGGTYERLRGRPFSELRSHLVKVSGKFRFGLNVVVNRDTVNELGPIARLATEVGAEELLLLPEREGARSDGIDAASRAILREWCSQYRGSPRLSISESNAQGLTVFNPTDAETGLAAYAHVDAFGVLKRSSFDQDGIPISQGGIMAALFELKQMTKEEAI